MEDAEALEPEVGDARSDGRDALRLRRLAMQSAHGTVAMVLQQRARPSACLNSLFSCYYALS
jgi:hypothetical protein